MRRNKKVGIYFAVFSTLFILFQNFSPSSSASQKTLVFILAGQTNMNGLFASTASNQKIPPNVYFYNREVKQANFAPQGHAGPEIGMATYLSQQYPSHKIILIKFAENGTALRQWVKNAVGSDGLIHSDSGQLFPKLTESVKLVIAQQELPAETEINGFFWMQGESDATEFSRIDLENELEKQYAANLQKFFGQIQSSFTLATDFQFTQGRIFSSKTSDQIIHGTETSDLRWTSNFISVRKAQSSAKAPFILKTISTDEFSRSDIWNFDSNSQVAFGKCLASSLRSAAVRLNCNQLGQVTTDYPSDIYLDPQTDKIKDQISNLFQKYQSRSPDYISHFEWLIEILNSPESLQDLEKELIVAGDNSLEFSCQQSGGVPINGKCSFGLSCITENEADLIIKEKSNTYVTCIDQSAEVHIDCKNNYGAERAFVANCPILNTAESIRPPADFASKINNLFQVYRKRNPDAEGYQQWITKSADDLENTFKNML